MPRLLFEEVKTDPNRENAGLRCERKTDERSTGYATSDISLSLYPDTRKLCGKGRNDGNRSGMPLEGQKEKVPGSSSNGVATFASVNLIVPAQEGVKAKMQVPRFPEFYSQSSI